MKNHNYYIYITTNPNRTVLYIGVTNNLLLRLQQHREASEKRKRTFTGRYFCFNLIYWEYYTDIRMAISREKELKGWSRKKKEALIAGFNPEWKFLQDPCELD